MNITMTIQQNRYPTLSNIYYRVPRACLPKNCLHSISFGSSLKKLVLVKIDENNITGEGY